MTVNKFIRNLLNLKELVVTHFELDIRNRALNLWVKPYKKGCRCPECNRRCRIVNETKIYRRWQELPIYGCIVLLWYCPKEVLCRTHGRVQENIPWAYTYGRVTYRFEHAMLIDAKGRCQDFEYSGVHAFRHASSHDHPYTPRPSHSGTQDHRHRRECLL